MRLKFVVAFCACLLLASAGHVGAGVESNDAAAAAESKDAARKDAGVPAHLTCKKMLVAVLDTRNVANDTIRRNDLPALIRLHDDIDERLRLARLEMDRAFLTGAWRSPMIKKEAADVVGQIEGVQMLNFISLAFLKGYESPTRQVSPSVADATDKMFTHLVQLLQKLDKLNAIVSTSAVGNGH